MPDNVAPMVDFNHTIVELVGNEVTVSCHDRDSARQHNCNQGGEINDLDGKSHGASSSERRAVASRTRPAPHSNNLGSSPCQVVRELSENCHFLVKSRPLV